METAKEEAIQLIRRLPDDTTDMNAQLLLAPLHGSKSSNRRSMGSPPCHADRTTEDILGRHRWGFLPRSPWRGPYTQPCVLLLCQEDV
jgi:hypothetical protein